ncbi:MAG: hypothetical protein O2960_15300 [Verrucomicrobia bacterium]|nr:hypothetical protein [Verrucomicrobiota bacterium]
MPAVSFANDVLPILSRFRGQMMWRFDMNSYEQVKANADLIWKRISDPGNPMPPPPFPPLPRHQIETFQNWIRDGCQP